MLSGVLPTRASLDLARPYGFTITSQRMSLLKTHSKQDGVTSKATLLAIKTRLSSIDSSVFVLGVYLALCPMMNSLDGGKSLQWRCLGRPNSGFNKLMSSDFGAQ
jgi:hypothetical protein